MVQLAVPHLLDPKLTPPSSNRRGKRVDRRRQEGAVCVCDSGGGEVVEGKLKQLHLFVFQFPAPPHPFFSPPFTSFSKYTSVKSGELEKDVLVEGAGGG